MKGVAKIKRCCHLGMAKIRLFYSIVMALILPQLKDIINCVLKLICYLFNLFTNSVCLSLCPWLSQVFGVIRTRPIHLTIYRVNILCYFLTPHTTRVKKLTFNIKWFYTCLTVLLQSHSFALKKDKVRSSYHKVNSWN